MRGRRTLQSTHSYNRVLLAVYWLAEDGTVCMETDQVIAREAGRSVETTRRYLRELEQGGVIAIFSRHARTGFVRQIVLLDHPDAPVYVEHFNNFKYTVSRRSEWVSAWAEQRLRKEDEKSTAPAFVAAN
jgi:hypothetical protein